MPNLMVNSTYTHKEIFLWELISNASDVAEHLRSNDVVQKAYSGN